VAAVANSEAFTPIADPAAIVKYNVQLLRQRGFSPEVIAVELRCPPEVAGVTANQPSRRRPHYRSQPVTEDDVLAAIAEIAARPLGPERRLRQVTLLLRIGERRFADMRQQWPKVEAACQKLYKRNAANSPQEQRARSQATLTAVIKWADAQMAAGSEVSLHAACRSAQKGDGWLSVLCSKGDARAIDLRERIRKYNRGNDNAKTTDSRDGVRGCPS
jgi:hypothetical protein